jgi:hypothetical protein
MVVVGRRGVDGLIHEFVRHGPRKGRTDGSLQDEECVGVASPSPFLASAVVIAACACGSPVDGSGRGDGDADAESTCPLDTGDTAQADSDPS